MISKIILILTFVEVVNSIPNGRIGATMDSGDYSQYFRNPYVNMMRNPQVVTTKKPEKKECYNDRYGMEYNGSKDTTETGLTCQFWETQTPNAHQFTSPTLFNVRRMSAIKNYCRNPNNANIGPWCFVDGPRGSPRLERCGINKCGSTSRRPVPKSSRRPNNILSPRHRKKQMIAGIQIEPLAEEECFRTESGIEYKGKKRTTKSGYICQNWGSQSPNPHSYSRAEMFGVSNISEVGNYCRNPNNDIIGPWCFVAQWPSRGPRFEACGISKCDDMVSDMEKAHRSDDLKFVDDWEAQGCAGPTCLPEVPAVVEKGCNKACNQAWTCANYERPCSPRNSVTNRVSACVDKLDICKRRVNPGKPCLSGMDQSTRWWYDHSDRSCRPFAYAGCGGNGNNFESENDCLGKCNNWQCFLGINVGTPTCAKTITPKSGPRWGYHYILKYCIDFHYFGCAGNKNRFFSKSECEAVCKPKITYIK